MIPSTSILRIARPTDNLSVVSQMYAEGLGFEVLSGFSDHDGFDGVIIGHQHHAYHLEFTHDRNMRVGRAPTPENLLIFYIGDQKVWKESCEKMRKSGFSSVVSHNPYWGLLGITFEDVDGYRVVLQNSEWKI
ncbi:MAG: VOC family protein [Gammaproteobacteria bacterium]|nr:MAG: VOC family protein [Gammaproteobacteria bacterium]